MKIIAYKHRDTGEEMSVELYRSKAVENKAPFQRWKYIPIYSEPLPPSITSDSTVKEYLTLQQVKQLGMDILKHEQDDRFGEGDLVLISDIKKEFLKLGIEL